MFMTAKSATGPRMLVFLLGGLTALAPFSTDMYLPALPAVRSSLDASTAAIQQTISVFYLGMAAGQLFHGPLSDRWGRKPSILCGLAIYLAACLGCAFVASGAELILWRVLQAIGGCAGVVIARAVARDCYQGHDMLRVMALLVTVMCISPLIAPFCGAWMFETYGWRSIFIAQAAVAAAMWLAIALLLRESRSSSTLALARDESPMRSYLHLLRGRRIQHYLIAACAPSAAAFCWVAASADIVIGNYGVAPMHLGYVFAANGIGVVAANQINVMLTRRWPSDHVMAVANYVCLGVAMVLFGCAFTGTGGLIGVLGPVFLLVSMLGFTQSNALAGALRDEPLRAGALSALLGSAMYLAGSAASAIAGLTTDGSPRATAAIILCCYLVATVNSAFRSRAALAAEG
jgi:DHA1 family bicyclomycin/chloramphenicol resistance-like MFS transporter